jgi:hypothetical protein
MVEKVLVREDITREGKGAQTGGESITPVVWEQGCVTVTLFFWESAKALAAREFLKRRDDWPSHLLSRKRIERSSAIAGS